MMMVRMTVPWYLALRASSENSGTRFVNDGRSGDAATYVVGATTYATTPTGAYASTAAGADSGSRTAADTAAAAGSVTVGSEQFGERIPQLAQLRQLDLRRTEYGGIHGQLRSGIANHNGRRGKLLVGETWGRALGVASLSRSPPPPPPPEQVVDFGKRMESSAGKMAITCCWISLW